MKQKYEKATVIRLLVTLKYHHNDIQNRAFGHRSESSLEDIPIEDVPENPLDDMIDIIAELKRRKEIDQKRLKIVSKKKKYYTDQLAKLN